MSIAFEDVSSKFKKTIKKLQQIGTIICSSVDSVVKNSFPSALEGVVSVDELINVGYNDSDVQFIDGVFYVNPDLYKKN